MNKLASRTRLLWAAEFCLMFSSFAYSEPFDASKAPQTNTVLGSTGKILYALKIKSSGLVGFTNAPNSTPVHLTFVRWGKSDSVFNVKNDENRAILIYNYRVQMIANPATNSTNWTTYSDDYPSNGQIGHLNAGESATFSITCPPEPLWRVCIIYSRGAALGDNPGTYWGNYELISPEVKTPPFIEKNDF